MTLLNTEPVKWSRYTSAVLVLSLVVILILWMFKPHRVNPEAQVEADKAKNTMLQNPSKDGYDKVIAGYRRAIELDSQWALPRAELAYAYAAASNAGYIDGRTAIPEARKAALEAIQIDPKLAKAYGALAWTQSLDYDEWPQAEATFRTALRLDPQDGQIHYWFGVHLRKKGKFKEAEEQDKTALALIHTEDPHIWCELAFLYWTSGQMDKFHAHMEEQQKTVPNFGLTQFLHARLLKLERNYKEADRKLDFAQELKFNPLTVLAERASLREYEGNIPEARREIEQLAAAWRTNEIDGLLLAGDYAGIKDYDNAFRVLEYAYSRRDNTLLSLATSPLLAPLHDDPRYKSLLQRLHFTDQIMQQIGFN